MQYTGYIVKFAETVVYTHKCNFTNLFLNPAFVALLWLVFSIEL